MPSNYSTMQPSEELIDFNYVKEKIKATLFAAQMEAE